MGLVRCKECGAEISEYAPGCPHCGAPLRGDEERVVPENERQPEEPRQEPAQTPPPPAGNGAGQQEARQAEYSRPAGGYSFGSRMQKPDNYLIWAILELIFCCLPFGIVGIIFSVRSNDAYNAGLYEESVDNAAKAKKWLLIGLACGLAYWIIMIVIYVIILGGAMAGSGVNFNDLMDL